MKGLLKLASYSFMLFIFFAYVGPFIVSLSPTWVRFNQALDDNDIPGGAIFYTEIPFIEDAEKHVNNAVDKGMQEWLEKQKAKN